MHFVRLVFFSFLLLFLVVTGISLFIPSRVRVSRALNMRASKELVKSRIGNLASWKDWNPFFENVNDDQVTIVDSAVGRITSVRINGTTIKIGQDKEGDYQAVMERVNNRPVLNVWNMVQPEVSDSLIVHWYMDFNLRWYPWEKFGGLLFERSYGPKMEKGLANLKKLSESDLSSIK